ncbi:CD63 antigen-like [Sycon ciliatum]|uniref:CD63 antigen-like n=1 Tax=Sycon ciliatum TaxID=27933 RepID=UPI0020A84970|eukprot:scpid85034/ scgid15614/ Tetraspanin-3; Tetraspanin TM4-A; Transmembrane 4 superfamily member 8 &gt; Tetraspanin-3
MCKCIEGIIRVLLFLFNIFLLACGIALIVVGGIVAAEYGKFAREDFFEQRFLWGFVGLALFVGCLLVLVGIFGVGGLCCKNGCMLKAFVFFIIIVIILEITICVLVFVYRDEGEESAKESISNLLQTAYSGESTRTTELLDELQSEFNCCGGFNISDYANATVGSGMPRIPDSCCRIMNGNCTLANGGRAAVTTENYYFVGCGEKLFDEIGDLGVGMFVIAIVVALLQFLGIILACKYIRDDSDSKHV